MSWEKRGDSDYYYRKCRVRNRVVSQYCGSGEIAENAAFQDQLQRAQKSIQRNMRSEEKQWDQMVRHISERNTLLFKAVMLVNGYHTHKGQWRKKNA